MLMVLCLLETQPMVYNPAAWVHGVFFNKEFDTTGEIKI